MTFETPRNNGRDSRCRNVPSVYGTEPAESAARPVTVIAEWTIGHHGRSRIHSRTHEAVTYTRVLVGPSQNHFPGRAAVTLDVLKNTGYRAETVAKHSACRSLAHRSVNVCEFSERASKARYTLATKLNSTRSTLLKVDKVDRVRQQSTFLPICCQFRQQSTFSKVNQSINQSIRRGLEWPK